MNKLRTIAASSMLALVPFQTVAADHEFTSTEVEKQIGTYLSGIQTTLAGNDTVSFEELSQMLVSAGNLLPSASAEGRRLMQAFPARLQVLAKQDQERQPIRAVNLTVFADAALSYLNRNTILGKETPGTVREVRLGVAPAPPPALPPSPSVRSSTIIPTIEQQSLLERGDSMLNLGDVSAARLLYQRAADSGVGIAALKLADTYDPAFLANHYLRGIKGDPAEAAKWYRKAASLGASEAEERLKILEKSLMAKARLD